MERLAEAVPVENDDDTQITDTENVGLAVLCPREGAGVVFREGNNTANEGRIQIDQSSELTDSTLGFHLPASLLSKLRQQGPIRERGRRCQNARTQFILYRRNELFVDERFNDTNATLLASSVITSTIGDDAEVRNSADPIEMSFIVDQDVSQL